MRQLWSPLGQSLVRETRGTVRGLAVGPKDLALLGISAANH